MSPLLTAAFLLASCERSAIDPSQSLVGAKQLPSARALSREIIQINRGPGTRTPGALTYELRPDDTLSITFYAKDWRTIIATQTLPLSSVVAARARYDLWRLRPEDLEGIEEVIRPADCPEPPIDTSPEATVAFIPKLPEPGVAHVEMGLVDIPYDTTCNTPKAVEARNLVRQILHSFPPSKIAAEYEGRARILGDPTRL